MPSVNVQFFALASETCAWIEAGIEPTGCDLFVVLRRDRTRQVFSRYSDIDCDQAWLLHVGYRTDVVDWPPEAAASRFEIPVMLVQFGHIVDGAMRESRVSTRSEPPMYDNTRKIADRIRRRTKTGLTVRNTSTGDQGASLYTRYSPGAAQFARSGGQLVFNPGVLALVPDTD